MGQQHARGRVLDTSQLEQRRSVERRREDNSSPDPLTLLKQKSSSYGAAVERVEVKVADDGTVSVGNYKLGKS